MAAKPKLAIYWAASCGGCEIAVTNLDERLFALDEKADFIFCPCLLDTKTAEIEALPDGAIALTLFNGAIRTTENLHMARLLRRKSRLLVAFGSCAGGGCIPALANLTSRQELLADIYLKSPALDNPEGIIPAVSPAPEHLPALPQLLDQVHRLARVVPVDYTVPGCPPEPQQIWAAVSQLLTGELPPPGEALGCGDQTVCSECHRVKQDTKIATFRRSYEFCPDAEQCLLEQGLLCQGIATRSGCGAPCTKANMPCTGCYGSPAGVADQGAKMIAALGSVLDLGDTDGLTEKELADRIASFLAAVPDPAGQFYRYTLAASILGRGLKR